MFEWKKFEEVLEIPIRNGLTKPRAIRGNGVKMIAMGELFAKSRIDAMDMDRVPVSAKELENCSIKENDLLFARQSLVLEGAGKCSIVTEVTEPTVFESHLIRVRIDPTKANPYFMFYYFSSPHGKANIRTIVEQAVQAGIRGSDLIKLSVPCPDIATQNKIAELLRKFDEKIELNQEVNYNLRQQVQLLYSQIAAEASNENKIPLVSDEVCRVLPTKITKYSGEKIYIATADVNEHSITNKATRLEYEDRPSRANMQPIPWSLWFAKMKASPKYIFINDQCPELVDDCIFSTGFFGLAANRDVFYYIWAFISSPEFDKTKDAYCSGTTMQALNNDGLEKISVYLPDKDVLDLFTETVEPIFNKIHSNIIENECLCALRDSLLPKLLSGAIDVSSI